jgi:hypothetical protein
MRLETFGKMFSLNVCENSRSTTQASWLVSPIIQRTAKIDDVSELGFIQAFRWQRMINLPFITVISVAKDLL